MSDLHEIYSKLGQVDWKLRSLLYVLEQLQDNVEHKETEFVLATVSHYLTGLSSDLEKHLEELDMYHVRGAVTKSE